MKFGGTCVEGKENQARTAERILEARDRGLSPVVVVSAMGRGGPYSTSGLESFVRSIGPKIEARERDLVMAVGEMIAAVAMAHVVKTMGHKTVALTGGQAGLITDLYYGNANIVDIRREGLLRWLDEDYIVFVTGFQGVTPNHDITTLGEGGSDYTAIGLAFALQQPRQGLLDEKIDLEPVHIYKEVDGVMTANPDNFDAALPKEKKPRLIPSMTYDEMVEMSRLGAQVMQHKAARMARQHHIPVVIRNFATNAPGTEISDTTVGHAYRDVTGVADMRNLLVFTVPSTNPRLGAQIAEDLEGDRLTYWEITTDPANVRFAVRREKYRDVGEPIARSLFERGLKADISEEKWGLVSLVGERLRGVVRDFVPKAESVLKAAGIETSGAIHGDISLSYLVHEDDAKNAVAALHAAFIE